MPDTGILIDPLEVGGSTARVIEGTSESLPYTMKFIDPDGTILPGWWDGNGVLQVLGRVVEIVLTEDGVPHTADVRRVGGVTAADPPVLEVHLIDEAAFDRSTLFEFNPTIQVSLRGPDVSIANWAGARYDGGGSTGLSSVLVTATSGDFRQISAPNTTGLPQFNAIVNDVIAAPSGANTSGNFKNLIVALNGTDRPITSFSTLNASNALTIVDAESWDAGTPGSKTIPDAWVYWPGGPTSGTVSSRFHFGGGPGVPTTPEMPYLIKVNGIRTLLTEVMDGTHGGGPMRFQLPPQSELPNEHFGPIDLAIPGPMLRRDFLHQIAKLTGLVLWFDGLGRLAPRPWPVPPIAGFTQVELDAMYRFDGTTAITPPTYDVKHSQSFNVWRAECIDVIDVGVEAARAAESPFHEDVILPVVSETDQTGISPITPNRMVHQAGMGSVRLNEGPFGFGPLAQSFLDATIGGLAEGRLRGHATTDAPDPGDLVLIDHDDLKGVNPATGARSGQQLARVVDKRRVYTADEVSFEYRVIYGGKA